MQLFSSTNISSFPILSIPYLFLIHFLFGGEVFIPVHCINFDFNFVFIKKKTRRFRKIYLIFRIDHCRHLTFGRRIFRMDHPVKALHGIYTTHALWYPIHDHNGINIAAWQSMSFVAKIPSIWFLPLKCISGTFCPVL